MRYVDAFCGMGGFSLALKAVVPNSKCVLAIDFDKDVADTFKRNFGIDCLGDILELDVETVPDHDILFGGFPCQPFSRNGKWYNKNGKIIEDDERANLFLVLINIINRKKPRFFVLENVTGLLSMKNKDGSSYFESIKSALRDTGYSIHVKTLDAADFGSPQQRKRVFFVGCRDTKDDFKFPESLKKTTCVGDILETNVDNKYLLENLWKNRKIINSPVAKGYTKEPNHSIPVGGSRLEALKEIYAKGDPPKKKTHKITPVSIIYGDTPSGLPRQQDKLYSTLGIAPTIATFSTPAFDIGTGWRQLTPRECARLQGFPDTFKLSQKDSKAYKQIGNAINIPTVINILKNLLDKERQTC